jgi:PAS domain S-box-containing protein
MRITPRTIRKANLIVTILAMISVPPLFALYLRLSHQDLLQILHAFPFPLFAMGIIIATSLLINYLNVALSRREEELKALHLQKRYRDLLETAYDAIIIHDSAGVIEQANPAAAALLAVPRERLPGDNLYRYIVGGLCATGEGGAATMAGFGTLSLIRGDGRPAKAEAACTAFQENGREMFLHIIRDVTEREVFEERRRILEKMATLGETAAKIAHEISNPLQGIVTYAESGIAKAGEGRLLAYFKAIHEQAERISRITTQYLKLSHQGAGEKKAVALGEIVEEALTVFVITGQGKHMRIEQDIPPDLPAIRADKNKLLQALLNLFVNAAHATDGKAERNLSLVARQSGRDVVLRVADNGSGISAENLSRVFDPFFTTKPEGEGTGLGLAIAREIIRDDHGGSMEIESTPGEGTVFTIRLPVDDQGGCGRPVEADRASGMKS